MLNKGDVMSLSLSLLATIYFILMSFGLIVHLLQASISFRWIDMDAVGNLPAMDGLLVVQPGSITKGAARNHNSTPVAIGPKQLLEGRSSEYAVVHAQGPVQVLGREHVCRGRKGGNGLYLAIIEAIYTQVQDCEIQALWCTYAKIKVIYDYDISSYVAMSHGMECLIPTWEWV